ncbi:unnamed protein product [Ceutorhynchus assimilis]|uniref:Major facilitator superfamily (MFS) profile domain-containing protein n=1 Tax=Ceutorhynchus assimilis TaxID=467358 RepID=A0A9N9N0A6_9CUCU|nr:unnamed protein product [Ceutorhynchus assimilis]
MTAERSSKNEKDTFTVEDTKSLLKCRYILAFLGFFGFANVYAMRVNLSVAIVAMVNQTATATQNGVIDSCPTPNSSTISTSYSEGEFNWDEKTQGIVLGAFFYGYVVTQIPGGRFAELYSSKMVFGLGVLVTAVFTILSPIAARINFPLFIIVRVIEGMGEGVTYPAMHSMLAKWIPPLERSKISSYIYSGAQFGTIISLPLSGWLCSLKLWGGWPLAFYLFGGIGLVWYIFWLFLAYDSPTTHPRIDEKEQAYILSNIGPQPEDRGPVPWMKMATCLPLWAILVTQCGASWAFYTQLTELPTYMAQILHFDIQANSLLSALPYFTSWLTGMFIGTLAEWLLAKNYISLLTSYRICNSIGTIIPSVGLLGVAFVGCDKLAVQLLLAITGAFYGALYSSNNINHMALSPKYAGTMFGITNAAANITGFLAPYVVGLLVNGQETLDQWNKVFYLAAAINIASNLFYISFASAEEVPWSKDKIVTQKEQTKRIKKHSIALRMRRKSKIG